VCPDPQREALLQIVEQSPQLSATFEKVQRIGVCGGDGYFSLVFTATEKSSKQRRALKFFHPLLRTPAPMNVYRWNSFQREVTLLNELAGQNDIITCASPLSEFTHVVPSTGSLTWNIPFAYYVLELAASDVRDAIENKKWNFVSKLTAFAAMCRAVQRLHSHQMCHRDLKPSNFLVMRDGAVKLGDLGAACKLDGTTIHLLTTYSIFPGERAYSSPEMLACLHDEAPDISYKGDFFGLGANLFELFTGAVLGDQAFDLQYYSDLDQFRRNVKSGNRHSTFHSIVDSIKASHQLPDLESFDPSLPKGVRLRLNELYKSLADVDHRVRLTDFSRIFNKIGICQIILQHEEKYRRWVEERRRRRAKRRLK
jgi:serine/threonine protein kinase